MPIIFIITFFDILTYFGILTWIMDKVGWVISKVSGLPKLKSFLLNSDDVSWEHRSAGSYPAAIISIKGTKAANVWYYEYEK